MLYQSVLEVERENERLKLENEELRKLLGKEPEKPMNCEACMFFKQYYVKVTGGYFKTCSGHCTQGRSTKRRKPEDKKCQYFELGKGW